MLADSYTFRGHRVPALMIESFQRYVRDRIAPGTFTMAVLCNDLSGALGHGDAQNQQILQGLMGYVWNEMPSECWGSKEKVRLWLQREEGEEIQTDED